MSEPAQKPSGIVIYTARKAIERQIEIMRSDANAKVWLRSYPDQEGAGADKLFSSITDAMPWIKEQEKRHRAIGIVVGEGGNKNHEITNTDWLYIDQDGDGSPLADTQFHLPPDFIVKRTDKKFHAFWKVCDCPVDKFRDAQKRLIAHYNSDKGKHSPAGVMRLAGSKHQKDLNNPVRLVLMDNTANTTHDGLGNDLKDLMAGLPELPPRDERAESKAKGDPVAADLLREALSYVDPSITYNKGWRDLIAGTGCTNCPEAWDIAHEFAEGKLDRQKRGTPANYHGPNPVDLILSTMRPMKGGVGTGTVWKICTEAGAPPNIFIPRKDYPQAVIDKLKAESASAPESVAAIVPSHNDGIKTISGSDDDFVIQYERVRRDTLRYVQETGQWRVWIDGRWRDVSQQSVWNDIMPLVRTRAYGESNAGSARKLTSKQTVSAVESLARGRYGFITRVEDWDRDTMVLNTPDGTVDLRTGILREANPRDLCSKSTAVTPSDHEHCPIWKKSLNEWTQGDQELQAYLKRLVGYCLTGDVSEHILAFLLGIGRNGKGTFQDTIKDMLGDYATTAPTTILIETQQTQHPTELAHLVGARVAFAEEIKADQKWAEAKLKQLTGGGKLVARKMRQDFFEFQPNFKLILLANHAPRLSTVDEAIKSRLHLIPFDYVVPPEQRDTDLREKLKTEMPGILRWAINGCVEWQRGGLNPPEAIRVATDEYVRSEDPLADWLEQRCERDRDAFTSASDLYRSYLANRGEGEPLSLRAFSDKLKSAGFKPKRTKACRGFLGIRLKPTPEGNLEGGDIADEF